MLLPYQNALLLPNCRLFNADCISGSAVLQDESIDLMICDPPFGIHEKSFDELYGRKKECVLDGYVEAPEDYFKFTSDWLGQAKRVLKPNGTIYLIMGWSNLGDVLRAVQSTGLTELNHIVWKYNFGVYATRKFVSSHYHILRLGKGKSPKFNTNCRHDQAERTLSGGSALYADLEDVWVIKKEYWPGVVKNANKLPDELIRKTILYSSDPGDIVCDFFMGNFTTAKVALRLGRKVAGFELNKNACMHHFPLVEQMAKSEFGLELGMPKKVGLPCPINSMGTNSTRLSAMPGVAA